jgi:hypothetical protein
MPLPIVDKAIPFNSIQEGIGMPEELEKLAENPETGISAGFPMGELARAYIIPQSYRRVLSPQEGLRKGTIFAELIRPYRPEGSGTYAEDSGRRDENE